MALNEIIIKGAREHNLKNLDITIPRNKLVVITGLSGSGKSTLAFDILYAEGQRRYVESLSTYARQFLEKLDKPDVDYIEGLSPAISIEQKTTSKNPRSTVGTVTEIYDYLRLLYSRAGKMHCYKCGREISSQTVQQIVDQVMVLPSGTKILILSPIVRGRKGEYRKEFADLKKKGFVRVRVDGSMGELDEEFNLDKNKNHDIEVVVDRLIIKEGLETRLADSIELSLKLSEGFVVIQVINGEEMMFSEHSACINCSISYPELTPRMFSFNSPHGACRECDGLGIKRTIDPELVVPDEGLSIRAGAIKPWEKKSSIYFYHMVEAVAEHYKFKLSTPFRDLTQDVRQTILYGSSGEEIKFCYEKNNRRYDYYRSFEGVVLNLERRYRATDSGFVREEIEQFMSIHPCPVCNGARLRKESLAVKVGEKTIVDITRFSIREACKYFNSLKLSPQDFLIAKRIVKEIKERLGFLMNVGLAYLTLDRTSATLSGGEAQRIRLATQIGSGLTGVLYILDEPSIGLHQRDNRRLLSTLARLRDMGNTVIVVEHDRDTILAADYVLDLGPGAGVNGGKLVAIGPPDKILKNKKSITGRYLSGNLCIPVPKKRRKGNGQYISILKAEQNNLKSINVDIPLGCFTCVTGVSGSGKSTLLIDILYKALAKKIYNASDKPGKFDKITGTEFVDKVIDIDQSPIGRTPRSNPATYTGIFTLIREIFAFVPEARRRGYLMGRFSFNVKGGRCEACAGDGIIKIEMHFLPDVYVTCEVCKGKRFNRETLEIHYKEKNISDVLNMTADEAFPFFKNIPSIKNKLLVICEVGLGYMEIGQAATTLSGGEAQRVKLARELSKKNTGKTIYILDEPTTGLHFADIQNLLNLLRKLTDTGNTVVVIEHNLDVIKTADYVIDLGPEGGDKGGKVVACGTPEDIMKVKGSYTGQFLKKIV